MGKINLKSLIINVAIPLAVGGLSYWVTKDNMNVFDMIVKPPLTPPAVVFPIVWTILFVLMLLSQATWARWARKSFLNCVRDTR